MRQMDAEQTARADSFITPAMRKLYPYRNAEELAAARLVWGMLIDWQANLWSTALK